MASASIDPVELGPWIRGMNNVKADKSLGQDELRDAVDLNIDDTGRITRRRGLTVVHEGSAPISGLYHPGDESLIFMEAGNLRRWYAGSATTLESGIGGSDLHCCDVNGDTFISNKIQTRRLTADGSIGLWSVTRPTSAPTLSLTYGSLYAGRYQVGFHYLDAEGRESGAMARMVSIDVPENGGIVASLPAPPADAHTTVVFCTEANGTTPYAQVSVSASQQSVVIGTTQGSAEIDVLGLVEFPPVSRPFIWRGRLWGAVADRLLFSPPLRYGLHDPVSGYLVADGPITMSAPVDGGLFVAAKTTQFWLGTSPDNMAPQFRLSYGAPEGSAVPLHDGSGVIWYSDRGFVTGTHDGSVQPLHDKSVAVPVSDVVATTTVERDGIKRAVAVPSGKANESGLTIGDYMSITERRKNFQI